MVLYRTQYAPQFVAGLKLENVFQGFNIIHDISFNFLCWPYYIKNYKPYTTDKSLSIDSSIDYDLLFKVPNNFKISFLGGIGFLNSIRMDRYSLGQYYWYTESHYKPFPVVTLGINLSFIPRTEIILKNSTGGGLNIYLFYSKNKYISNEIQYSLFNRANIEILILILNNYKLITGWYNKFFIYEGDAFIQNMIYIGFEYAF